MENVPSFMKMFIPSKIIIAVSPNKLDFKVYLQKTEREERRNHPPCYQNFSVANNK